MRFQGVNRAWMVLKDDQQRSQWEKNPQDYQPPWLQAKGGDTYDESFHPSAFENDSVDQEPHFKKAESSIHRILSEPKNASALKELKAINDDMKKELDESDDLTLFEDIRIKIETIQGFVASAHQVATSSKYTQEERNKKLQGNNAMFKSFIDQQGYPEDWYKDLPVDDARTKVDVAGPDTSVRTKYSERILGYSNVGRGHQFIIEVNDPAGTYELKSGAEIGFPTVEAYFNSAKGTNQLGECDKKYDRKDAHRYLGVYGVASKPLQTATVGGRSRLPTAWVLTGFGDEEIPTEKVWLTRTTVRRVCGKVSADEDIRQWYLDNDLQPVDEIPPKVEKRRLDKPGTPTPAGTESLESLTQKIETLTKLVTAMQSMQAQQLQQQKGLQQEKV